MSSFLKTEEISANLRFSGIWQLLNILLFILYLLKHRAGEVSNIRSFLKYFSWDTIWRNSFLSINIFFSISQIQFSKLKTCIKIKIFSNSNNLGWFSYSLKGIYTGSGYLIIFEITLHFLISNLSTASSKKLLVISATFHQKLWLPFQSE